jgi:hypothetical protein
MIISSLGISLSRFWNRVYGLTYVKIEHDHLLLCYKIRVINRKSCYIFRVKQKYPRLRQYSFGLISHLSAHISSIRFFLS